MKVAASAKFKIQEILQLWRGDVSQIDGGLQILLLIDYIVDWALELYIPGSQRHASSASDELRRQENNRISLLNSVQNGIHRATAWGIQPSPHN